MSYDASAVARQLAAELETNGIDVDTIADRLRAAHSAGRVDGIKLPELPPAKVDRRLKPSPRQAMILAYLVDQIEATNVMPTLREIGHAFNINSTNGVIDHLKALERKGYLERAAFKSRAIKLLDWPKKTILGQLRAIGAPEFPVDWALRICAQAADHLEHALDWDGHGWETVRAGVRVAAAYLDDRMPNEADLGCGPATSSVEKLRSRAAFGSRMGE
jgi:hypothetical protein